MENLPRLRYRSNYVSYVFLRDSRNFQTHSADVYLGQEHLFYAVGERI